MVHWPPDEGRTPTQLDAPCSFMHPDGTWEHHIRQSDIGRFRKCPDLQRRHLDGILPGREGDSALIGTACHEGIRWALNEVCSWVEPLYDEALLIALQTLTNRWGNEGFSQVQIPSLDEACRLASQCMQSWWATFYPHLTPEVIAGVEQQFDVLAMKGPKRHVYLAGTMDLRFTDLSVVDWKFPGDPYTGSNAWKHQRYDNQPTHYLWASLLLDGTNPLLMQRWDGGDKLASRDDALPDFTYGVTIRGKGVSEELDISRSYGDVQFYAQEIHRLCDLIEAQLPTWPLNPTDWWCSDKWCEAWDTCRGQYLPPDPFGLMAKVAELTGQRVTPVVLDQGDPFDGLPSEDDPPTDPRWDASLTPVS